MSITTTISKPLEQGYVQVDASYKNGYTRYYKVPQKNAKDFANKLQKQDKDMNLYSNIIFFSSIVAGVLGAYHFTKNMEGSFKRFLVQTGAAMGLSAITSFGFNKYAQNEEVKLIQANHAREIFYQA